MILDDADLSVAVPAGVAACYENSGQICSALSRMIVPSSRLDEAGELAVQAAGTFRPGDLLPYDLGAAGFSGSTRSCAGVHSKRDR